MTGRRKILRYQRAHRTGGSRTTGLSQSPSDRVRLAAWPPLTAAPLRIHAGTTARSGTVPIGGSSPASRAVGAELPPLEWRQSPLPPARGACGVHVVLVRADV